MGHDCAQNDIGDLSLQLISSTNRHNPPFRFSSRPFVSSRIDRWSNGTRKRVLLALFSFREHGQYLVAMIRGTDSGPHLSDLSIRIDQEGVASGDSRFAQRAVLPGHLLIRIGQKLERQTLLGAKVLVAIRRVDADADDDRIELIVFGKVALKIMRLNRAAGSVVFGIEVKHHPLTPEVLQADLAPVL